MKKVLTASCLCKGVKFKTLNKLRSVSNCHCIQCRKTHGVFGAYTNIKDKEIKFLNKTTLKWFKSSKKWRSSLRVTLHLMAPFFPISTVIFPVLSMRFSSNFINSFSSSGIKSQSMSVGGHMMVV